MNPVQPCTDRCEGAGAVGDFAGDVARPSSYSNRAQPVTNRADRPHPREHNLSPVARDHHHGTISTCPLDTQPAISVFTRRPQALPDLQGSSHQAEVTGIGVKRQRPENRQRVLSRSECSRTGLLLRRRTRRQTAGAGRVLCPEGTRPDRPRPHECNGDQASLHESCELGRKEGLMVAVLSRSA
jgi:hypothetical protein